jgi:hypothetical protein
LFAPSFGVRFPRLPSSAALSRAFICKVAREGDTVHRNVGPLLKRRLNAFIDLCPIDIAHTEEILGLKTYFRPVMQKPQGFGTGITSRPLNAAEFLRANRWATTC